MSTTELPETIYLIDTGEHISWCDTPTPGPDMEASDATPYIQCQSVIKLIHELKNCKETDEGILANIYALLQSTTCEND